VTGLLPAVDHPAFRALGWALLHFVWQGALVAGLAALAFRLLRGHSPQARYAVGCAALLLMLAAPVATGIAAYEPAASLAAGPLPAGAAERQAVLSRLADVAREVRPGEAWRYRVEAVLPSLVAVWMLGILVLSARLAGGWGYAQRLARREVRPAPAAWQRRLDGLARRLGVARPVRLLESARVQVPTVVGWLRPVVLLPFTAATGLTPAQLEAVLLHELAHVRRHDYLVNLAQSAVEVLLFYHPGVWWVSERVREEREACCDDVAVAACGDTLVYARALTELEGLRAFPAGLAMAADGGSLLHRVRRLVLPAPRPARGSAPLLAGVLLLTTLAAAAAQRALVPAEQEGGAAPAGDAFAPGGRTAVPAPSPAASDESGPAALAAPVPLAAPAARPAAPAPVRTSESPPAPGEPTAAPEAPAAPAARDTLLVARVRRIATETRSTGETVRLLVEVAPEVTRDARALDAYLDAAESIGSASGRRAALAAVLGTGDRRAGGAAPAVTPPPPAPPTAAPGPAHAGTVLGTPARTRAQVLPVRSGRVDAPDTPLARALAEAESISSPSRKRQALSTLLREYARDPE